MREPLRNPSFKGRTYTPPFLPCYLSKKKKNDKTPPLLPHFSSPRSFLFYKSTRIDSMIFRGIRYIYFSVHEDEKHRGLLQRIGESLDCEISSSNRKRPRGVYAFRVSRIPPPRCTHTHTPRESFSSEKSFSPFREEWILQGKERGIFSPFFLRV